jgi:uncharacterized membrane protein YkoI
MWKYDRLSYLWKTVGGANDSGWLETEVNMRMKLVFAGIAVVSVGVTAAFIQHAVVQEEQAGLIARARLSPEQAREKALAAMPGGQIVESEIEEEDGRLIYSFDVKISGQDGHSEVEIDAMTGAVLSPESDDDDDDGKDDDDERKGDK